MERNGIDKECRIMNMHVCSFLQTCHMLLVCRFASGEKRLYAGLPLFFHDCAWKTVVAHI